MLVDSGSSSSYVGSHLMPLFPQLEKLSQPVKVQVADGGVLSCQYQISMCSWWCQGHTFVSDLKVLPLGCYDLILGMDWWSSLILWKFIGQTNGFLLSTRAAN